MVVVAIGSLGIMDIDPSGLGNADSNGYLLDDVDEYRLAIRSAG